MPTTLIAAFFLAYNEVRVALELADLAVSTTDSVKALRAGLYGTTKAIEANTIARDIFTAARAGEVSQADTDDVMSHVREMKRIVTKINARVAIVQVAA